MPPPEPAAHRSPEDPARAAESADSVPPAALPLQERLNPLERAVFVLRELCDVPFPEVASGGGPFGGGLPSTRVT